MCGHINVTWAEEIAKFMQFDINSILFNAEYMSELRVKDIFLQVKKK